MNVAAHITPQTLRTGEPEALAGVCDRRGAAVYAYCQQAAGPEAAVAAAAEAFAQFRRAILPEGALSGKGQAEKLLRSAARRCALVHADEASAGPAGDAGAEGCDVQGGALLVYVEGALGPAEREVVATHVADCVSCAAALRRLQDAEAAFSVKPGTPLPVPVAREILTALAHAAPVSAHGGDESAVRDEALRLLTDAAVSPTPEPAPEPAPEPEQPEPQPAPASVAPEAPPPPTPARPQALAPPKRRMLVRLRGRLPRPMSQRFGPSLPAMLLRGSLRLLAVVIAAGAVGVLLGVGLAELTGN